MKATLHHFYENINQEKAKSLSGENADLLTPATATPSLQEIAKKQLEQLVDINDDEKNRLWSELFGYGPLEKWIGDDEVTEILCNQFDQIFYERKGVLIRSVDQFESSDSYNDFVERLCQQCQTFINREKPFVECQIKNLRVTIIYQDLARGFPLVAIRKKRNLIWPIEQLKNSGWCTDEQFKHLQSIISGKHNFLVIGGTGSGKTTVLQSLMTLIPDNERIVVIEDTQELVPTNAATTSLLTHINTLEPGLTVTMDDLLKRTLRLRPDRIAVGEIRGPEAKTLLMALSTGHDGSFGSMHARTAHEALVRLEMLVQMGAPEWSLYSIRRLISITLSHLIVVERRGSQRRLEGIYEVASLEENGLIVDKVC